ncbi:MAG: hypothetical protein HY052_02120 [Proteobacteria bacterium]|nr:hypothetical protein [Pseudomonadota bacterium]
MDQNHRNRLNKEISQVFNRFAGQIVDPANPSDPVLKAMNLEAFNHFSTLRLVSIGTQPDETDDVLTRINAELISAGGGKWRIGNRFFRG